MKIGFFDSGFGGLPILQATYRLLPQAEFIYVADHAHLPYGSKTTQYIKQRSHTISQWLVEQAVDSIVIACNTATTAALVSLRRSFSLPFIGTEPAIKPAVSPVTPQRILVLATNSTLKSARFRQLINLKPHHHHLTYHSLPQWINLVESGQITGSAISQRVKRDLKLLNIDQFDSLVLACTHYLYFKPLIHQLFTSLTIHDPSASIAKQVVKITPSDSTTPSSPGKITLFTTSSHPSTNLVQNLLPLPARVESVHI